MDEFLEAAQRTPAGFGYGFRTGEGIPPGGSAPEKYFDDDAASILTTRFPLALLARVTRSESLPARLRREVAIAAWTRAILLGDEKAALDLSPVLAHLGPALKNDLATFDSAASPAERRFAAVFLLLHAPGMRTFIASGFGRATWGGKPEDIAQIDNIRANWWCQPGVMAIGAAPASFDNWKLVEQAGYGISPVLRLIYPDGQLTPPAFLSPGQAKEAASEWERLCKIPAGPAWLGRMTMSFARANPQDPRVPEALHLVVRSTRYGCASRETSEYSHRAFSLLQRRYPESEWAKATKCWF